MEGLKLQAYGQLAQAMTRHALAMAIGQTEFHDKEEDTRNLPRPLYFHEFMSTFENTADDLAKLGVLTDVSKNNRTPIYYAFNCEPDDASEIAEGNWQKGPPFEQLLVHSINLFGDFGTEYWGFSTKRNFPFGLTSRIGSALDALAMLGYLKKTKDGYVWTSLATTAMFEAGYWDK